MSKYHERLYPVYITVEIDVSMMQRLMGAQKAIKAKIIELGEILCPNGKTLFLGEKTGLKGDCIYTGSFDQNSCQILVCVEEKDDTDRI